MSKTQLVVKLDTEESLPVRARFEESPPTVIIEFPSGRVLGSIPEHSVIQRGAIQEIHTAYASAIRPVESRWIQAIKIQLRGPYRYEVRSEAGRIVVEVEHPAAVASQDIEVELAGGAMMAGARPSAFSERFRAMQEALDNAQRRPWIWQARSVLTATPELQRDDSTRTQLATTLTPVPMSRPVPAPLAPSQRVASGAERFANGLWVFGWIGLVGALGIRWLQRSRRRLAGGDSALRLSSGIRVIDQLVWRAFERQGYQLIQTVELSQPLGLMRIMSREGLKAALFCVADGVFFEKTMVEQCIRSMRQAQAERGFLVAPGSFTVPAQRCAKESGVTLMGRDQLIELFSEGAMSEYSTKQLQQLQVQLNEAKETLEQYARQLNLIRRQRNEASWFLGEERAKNAKLEEQLADAAEQIRHWQTQAEQLQQAVESATKQWEESQWYLGETKASAQHLEEQLRSLREAVGQLEERNRQAVAEKGEAQRQREEANWYLGESRVAEAELRQQLEQLQARLAQAQERVETERERRHAIEAEFLAVRTYGERRKAFRFHRPNVTLELQTAEGTTLFRDIPRNLSRTGFSFDAEGALDLPAETPEGRAGAPNPLRVRLYLPNREQPIESTGRLVWRRQDPMTHRYVGGCELADLPTETREAFEQSLAHLS
jgi:hypothetical protein